MGIRMEKYDLPVLPVEGSEQTAAVRDRPAKFVIKKYNTSCTRALIILLTRKPGAPLHLP